MGSPKSELVLPAQVAASDGRDGSSALASPCGLRAAYASTTAISHQIVEGACTFFLTQVLCDSQSCTERVCTVLFFTGDDYARLSQWCGLPQKMEVALDGV